MTIGLLGIKAKAGDVTYDFDTDPTGILTTYGNATWRATGGNGDPTTSGYLSITDAANGQFGSIVFDDADGGAIVAGFTFDCDLRTGGGTGRPADGYSINFARLGDPVLVAGNVFAGSPNGNESSLPEEGTRTGISVCLDQWDSGAGDVVGITVRVDGAIVFNKPYPTSNGAVGDLTSLETGPAGQPVDANFDVPALGWAHLHINVTKSGALTVSYKGEEIMTDFASGFFPSAGNLVFAGRTGGANSHHHVDNIHLVTIPSDLALVSGIKIDGCSVTAQVQDSGSGVVDPSAIRIKLDGVDLPPASYITSKDGATSTAKYITLPTVLAAGSSHVVTVSFTDGNNQSDSTTSTLTVANFALVPAGAAVAGIDPNTASSGFVARVHQLTFQRFPGDANATLNAERELADGYLLPDGSPQPNAADLTAPDELPDFFYRESINWNQDAPAAVGNFNTGTGNEDQLIPGIPGGGGTDSIVASARAFLKLDAGCYRFGVNSDDGFLLTFGYGRGDIFGVKAGEFNGGRGASDTTFDVVVQASGYYPIRLDWWEGTGGANVELFSVDTQTGAKHLVNDANDAAAIKAYRTGSGPAYADSILPVVGERAASAKGPITVKIYDDGANAVGTITMTLDGAAAAPDISKDSGITTVSLAAPVDGYFPGSTHTGTITYDGRVHNFNFKVTYLVAGIFDIEAEDFDYDSGTSNPQAGVDGLDVNVMPYFGGAYSGLSAVLDVDYHNADGNDSDVYRAGESPNVNITGQGLPDRGEWSMTANYRIGWVGGGDWQNYTRDIPNSAYAVIAALSFDGRAPGQLHGTLDQVTAGVGTASQTLSPLGTFDAPGSGGWGNNNIVVMKDIDGKDAVIRLSGVKTLRFNMVSGDFDWFALVPLPGLKLRPALVSVSPADGSTVARNAPVHIVIKNQDTKVKAVGGVKLVVDSVDVTAQTVVTVNGDLVDVKYAPNPQFSANSAHTYTIDWSDDDNPSVKQSRSGNWSVNLFGNGDFVIEAEDFNYDSGQSNPKAGVAGQDVNVMPYYGGAYDQLGAIQDVDYRSNNGNDSDVYRKTESPNVNMNDNLGLGKSRSGWDMTTNYKIGWVGGDQWQNYTRNIPNLVYKVYAALSFDGHDPHQLSATLDQVTGDITQPNQATTRLGSFDAPGSGGWGLNNFVEMKDLDGNTALVHLNGLTTLRMSHGSGDYDYFVLVPSGVDKLRPIVSDIKPAIGATVSRNWPLTITIQNRDTAVKAGGVKLVVAGVDVTGQATIDTSDAAKVVIGYKASPQYAANSTISYTVTFTDTDNVAQTKDGNLKTSVFGDGDFLIEAEDFDYDGGQSNPKAGVAGQDVNVMPYLGGAYDGLGAIADVDYKNDDGNESDVYRKNETPNANINDNIGDRARSGWNMTTNYKIGWIGNPDFENYTRSIPAGDYEVYAAISHGESNPHQLIANLDRVTSGVGTASQVLAPLGTFDGTGTGGWGNNARVPMKDGNGANAVVTIGSGPTTLRMSNASGDFDYFILVKHVPVGPHITSIVRIPPAPGFPLGGVTVTWDGGCELQVSDNVTGPYVTVPGATSPLTAGVDRAKRFARIRCP